MMLQTLLWPDEIRPAILEGLDKEAKVRPQEVTMAASLIETLAAVGEVFSVGGREMASDDDGDDEDSDFTKKPFKKNSARKSV